MLKTRTLKYKLGPRTFYFLHLSVMYVLSHKMGQSFCWQTNIVIHTFDGILQITKHTAHSRFSHIRGSKNEYIGQDNGIDGAVKVLSKNQK